MAKKIFIFIILLFLFIGAFGLYSAYKYRQAQRLQQKSTAKAPQVSVTFPEGWTNRQVGDYLEKNGVTSASDFLSTADAFDASDYLILSSKPKSAGLEGFIFPDTYFIPKTAGSSTTISDVIIKKALDNFSAKFTSAMQQQASKLGMSIYQIVTLASIIEKETGSSKVSAADLDTQRKMVAGVFYNRLNAGMALQSDATVSYAMTQLGKNPEPIDTAINSPYNTYKYPGLPYGPICNPSLSSIKAALSPTANDYVYFLSVPGTGEIIFSKTFEEHQKNKAKYLR